MVRVTETLVETDDGFAYGPPKTKSAVRTVPLPAFAVERLRAHRVAQAQRRLALGADWRDADLVVERGDGQPVSPGAYTHGFARLSARAGLEGVRLHDLRHGVATSLARRLRRAELTSMVLGHSSIAFTASTYVHPDDEDLDTIGAALDAAFGG